MEKNEIKRASKESRYAVWTIGKWIVVVGVILITAGLLVFWTLTASGIITMNIKREVVQRSQQYTEAKVNLLNKLYNDWTQLDAEIAELKTTQGTEEIIGAKVSQQRAIVIRIKTESKMIPSSEVPNDIKQFISAN